MQAVFFLQEFRGEEIFRYGVHYNRSYFVLDESKKEKIHIIKMISPDNIFLHKFIIVLYNIYKDVDKEVIKLSKKISLEEVKQYLLKIKTVISNKNYTFQKRNKNLESLANIGITISQAINYILEISPYDYSKGPEDEKDERFLPGECMVFGKNVNGCEVYIKIKLTKRENNDYCIVLSFHEAEFPICYIYK